MTTPRDMLQAEIEHLRRLYQHMTFGRPIESMDLALAVARLERVAAAMEKETA